MATKAAHSAQGDTTAGQAEWDNPFPRLPSSAMPEAPRGWPCWLLAPAAASGLTCHLPEPLAALWSVKISLQGLYTL